ncbi:hypothetical protein ACLOJK_022525 [Asimina triloba]
MRVPDPPFPISTFDIILQDQINHHHVFDALHHVIALVALQWGCCQHGGLQWRCSATSAALQWGCCQHGGPPRAADFGGAPAVRYCRRLMLGSMVDGVRTLMAVGHDDGFGDRQI